MDGLELLLIITVLLVAVAMALALAHALELPGKLRLSEEQYRTVQPIYYPGFTLGGAAEPAALILLIVVLFMTPLGTAAFWLTAGALAALALMHATYWLLTHPVNSFWLKDMKIGAGRSFFAFDPLGRASAGSEPEWTELRDRWEYSHVARAGFALISLTLLVASLVV